MADATPETPEADPAHAVLPPIADPISEGEQFEVVAHACAIAIADAVAYLRNTQIIANAVVGVAMERLLADQDPIHANTIEVAQASVTAAVEALQQVGLSTATILKNYPAPAE